MKLLLLITLLTTSMPLLAVQKVLHGEDDRVESYEYGDPLFQKVC